MKLKNPILIGIFIVCLFKSYAQKGFEVGPWIGVSNYFGDLNTSYRLNDLSLAGGMGVRYNFGHRVCLRGSLNYGKIKGFDKNSKNTFEQSRNLDFRSNIFDFAAVGEFNFLKYSHGSRSNNFSPYLLLGFNVYHFAPYTFLGDDKHYLRPLGTEGQLSGSEYGSISGGIVYGAGVKFDINYLYSINIELSFRSVFTDYLDDVSGLYVSKSKIKAMRGEVAAELSNRSENPDFGLPGTQRGDNSRKDQYTLFGIGVVRYFGNIECPDLSSRSASNW